MRTLKRVTTDPPGGWYFKVPETEAFIKAGNYWKLITYIKDHYNANDLKVPDDLEAQVQDQICRNIPENFCNGEGGHALAPDLDLLDKGTRKVITAIRQTDGGMEKVSESVDRVPVCVSCRFNNNRVGCFTCTSTYKFCAGALKHMDELHAKMARHCDIFEAFCVSLVSASPKVLHKLFDDKDLNMIPDNCWIKRILVGEPDDG